MSTRDWTKFEDDLREAVATFSGCDERSLVLGEGNRNADAVLIGEAPGGQEDKAGRPFVGPAGKLLNELLEEVGLDRESVWVTNVVKCRPTQVTNGRVRNRAPSREEFDYFLPWFEREIRLVKPDVLVCLGATAAKAVLGRSSVKMGDIRGEWLEGVLGVDTLVTYHPSYLLRQTTQRDDRYDEMLSDLKLAYQRISGGH